MFSNSGLHFIHGFGRSLPSLLHAMERRLQVFTMNQQLRQRKLGEQCRQSVVRRAMLFVPVPRIISQRAALATIVVPGDDEGGDGGSLISPVVVLALVPT